jgi:hypothetical protein
MLEKLIKGIKKKVAPIVLSGILALSPGCATIPQDQYLTFKTISPEAIQPVSHKPSVEIPEAGWGSLTYQEVIEFVKTPEQAQCYLDNYFVFDPQEAEDAKKSAGVGESFKYNHAKAKGVCFDHATAAAALLSDNGYAPLLLGMKRTKDDFNHMVFVYRTKNGFGCLGNTPMPAKYSSVNDLVKAFNGYWGGNFDKYGVLNLDSNFDRETWISSDEGILPLDLDKTLDVE